MKKAKIRILMIPLVIGVCFCVFKSNDEQNYSHEQGKTNNNTTQLIKPINSETKSDFETNKKRDIFVIENTNYTIKCKADNKKEEKDKIIFTDPKDIEIEY